MKGVQASGEVPEETLDDVVSKTGVCCQTVTHLEAPARKGTRGT
jgi:hypothetical protein